MTNCGTNLFALKQQESNYHPPATCSFVGNHANILVGQYYLDICKLSPAAQGPNTKWLRRCGRNHESVHGLQLLPGWNCRRRRGTLCGRQVPGIKHAERNASATRPRAGTARNMHHFTSRYAVHGCAPRHRAGRHTEGGSRSACDIPANYDQHFAWLGVCSARRASACAGLESLGTAVPTGLSDGARQLLAVDSIKRHWHARHRKGCCQRHINESLIAGKNGGTSGATQRGHRNVSPSSVITSSLRELTELSMLCHRYFGASHPEAASASSSGAHDLRPAREASIAAAAR